MKPGPTLARLKELAIYDADTGTFTARVHRKGISVGAVLGSRHNAGYVRICIDKEDYLAHRLAWLYVHGEWPSQEIDHINGNRSDNRIANLRPATSTQNKINGGLREDNASGFRGVHFDKRRQKFIAQIKIGSRRKYIGQYDTAEAAGRAYLSTATATYGEFARACHGIEVEVML